MSDVLSGKHVKLAESFLGLGALVLEALSEPMNVDDLLYKIQTIKSKQKLRTNLNFERFLLSLDLLYSLGIISIDTSGRLIREIN